MYLPGDEVDVKTVKIDRIAVRREKGKTYATVVGVVENQSFIPLEIAYRPKVNDSIVGFVVGRKSVGYFVETGTAYTMIALARELQTELRIGDMIFAKIARIEEDGTVILSNIRKLRRGKILEIPSSKVPRVIGKEASMINLIKKKTNTVIYVGANGYVYIGSQGSVSKAIEALNMIVRRSHLSGLTDTITEFLEG